jgi:hypothetical protein
MPLTHRPERRDAGGDDPPEAALQDPVITARRLTPQATREVAFALARIAMDILLARDGEAAG